MSIRAVRYIRPMEQGWSQPHLFRCEDGQSYVVKLMNNRDGPGILANELIAYRLGKRLGLPMAPYRVIQITKDLIEMFPVMKQLDVPTGPHLGSLFFERGTTLTEAVDLSFCKNVRHAAGMIVFDHWINNGDRQVTSSNLIYIKDQCEIRLIDHSDAFFGPDWRADEGMDHLEDMELFWGPLYERFVPFIDGSDPFDRYVSLVESMSEKVIHQAVQELPRPWGIPQNDAAQLTDFLMYRKNLVREVLNGLKGHFPAWNEEDQG